MPAAALGLIKHEVPRARHDADEFADCLVRLRPARRQATLFALNAESSLDQVVDLSWHDVREMQQIRSEVRNILLARSRVRPDSLTAECPTFDSETRCIRSNNQPSGRTE